MLNDIPARWRTVSNKGTMQLLGASLDPRMVSMVEVAARVTDAQIQRASALSHRAMVEPLALAVGMSQREAESCGDVLDALQVIIDLADNLTDAEEDRSRGLDLATRYEGLPLPALQCLPPLMMAAVMGALPGLFPAPRRAQAAALRTTSVLSRMVLGQLAPGDSRERIDGASGQQGLLLCLPLWLTHDGSPEADRRLREVERWAFLFGCTWQLHQDVLDAPSDRRAQSALARGILAVRAAWPTMAPFREHEALAPEALMAGGLC